MKVNHYKCDDCKAEFEGVGGGSICPACDSDKFNKIGEREVDEKDIGCAGGCGSCKGCH